MDPSACIRGGTSIILNLLDHGLARRFFLPAMRKPSEPMEVENENERGNVRRQADITY